MRVGVTGALTRLVDDLVLAKLAKQRAKEFNAVLSAVERLQELEEWRKRAEGRAYGLALHEILELKRLLAVRLAALCSALAWSRATARVLALASAALDEALAEVVQ